MKYILHVIPSLSRGGTEMVIFNLYQHMDHNKFKFDFLVEETGPFENAFSNISTIHKIPFKNVKQYKKDMESFFKNNRKYNIIHTHTSPHMGIVLELANKFEIKGRIAHSHNARNDIPKVFRIIKTFKSIKIEKNANLLLACSYDAAKWLYPTRYKSSYIIRNGIEHKVFKFSNDSRKKNRKKLNLKVDDFAIVMTARLSIEKNHKFAVELMRKLCDFDNRIKLFIIGDGPLESQIRHSIDSINLKNNVFILGYKKDVGNLLSAFDFGILPSRAEGLGLALIEYQVNGMNCISSSSVPDEANIGSLERLDLNISLWSERIMHYRNQYSVSLRKRDVTHLYDIREESKRMSDLYCNITYLNSNKEGDSNDIN